MRILKQTAFQYVLLIITFIFANGFFVIQPASAQNILTIGEIIIEGSVFIESSNNQWISSGSAYPLLQGTAIKTENGIASLYFKDGSRVDLSKNTIAVIDGYSGDYSIKLGKGVISYNISPSASLGVETASAYININSNNDIVQKVGYEKPQRSLGIISTTDKGTEVRNIYGKMQVNISASELRQISSGETIFIGSDNKYRIYKTQSVAKVSEENYIIKKGDLLEIKTEKLEGVFEVNSEGNITLPGNISLHVEGLTTADVKELIVKKLSKPLLNTYVRVLEKDKAAGAYFTAGSGSKIAVGAILGVYFTTGSLTAYYSFRRGHGRGHASPHSF